jgi:DNA polymerase III subunit alpha
MGKKDIAAMKEQKEKFISGAVQNGIQQKIAGEIFEGIDKFANYGFNKSHAVAYSYVAYQTAYLKTHYTAEFLAANLTNEFGNATKVASMLEDCRKLKIEVLPPDINSPTVYFDVADNKIRFGMSAIKNVGISAVEEIISSRKKKPEGFASIFDFCSSTDTRVVNKRVLEGLITAGAFDTLHKNRAQLLAGVELALEFGNKVQNSKMSSADSLFGEVADEVMIAEPQLPQIEPWTRREQLSRERGVLGFYVTDHPLKRYEVDFKSFATIHLGESEKLQEEETVFACGVITDVKTKIDKSNKTMAFFTLDDFSGSCESLMFSKIYDKCGRYVIEEECVFIKGRPESSGDAIKLHIDDVIPLEYFRENHVGSIKITVDKEKHGHDRIILLKNIFSEYPGNTPVYIHLMDKGKVTEIFSLKETRVNINDKFIDQVHNCLGEDTLLFIRK